MGVIPVSSGLDFLAARPVFRTSANDLADTVVHTVTSPEGMLSELPTSVTRV